MKKPINTSGYSSTPLINKLGIKPGFQIHVPNVPKEYFEWLGPLPDEVKWIKKVPASPIDFIHIFAKDQKTFETLFLENKPRIKKGGTIWVSWPKKSSGVITDLSENIIRDHGLANGLVDVKVCAVSNVWSGLKFVYRTKDR